MSYLRRLPKFEYVAAQTIAEVCSVLSANPTAARLLAGGTDLILQMRHRETTPRYIVGLKSVAEMRSIRQQNGDLVIGAMTTIDTLLSSELIRGRFGILSDTAAGMGSPEVRNLATLGGNLAGALPCADFPPALIALAAKVKLESCNGTRLVPVEDFYPEFGRTVAAADEVLTEIHLPLLPPRTAGVYLKFHDRHSMDLTTIGVSAVVTRDEEGIGFQNVRIALASSAPVPLRAKKAEEVLISRPFSDEALEDAASRACEEASPRNSWRATREFRMQLIATLTKRALKSAWEKAASDQHSAISKKGNRRG